MKYLTKKSLQGVPFSKNNYFNRSWWGLILEYASQVVVVGGGGGGGGSEGFVKLAT